MIGILIFSIVVILISIGFRFFGSKYYDKIYAYAELTASGNIRDEIIEFDNDDDDELVAVIAAAASQSLNKRVLVKKIRSINPKTESAWSQSGRSNVMGSHSLKINR